MTTNVDDVADAVVGKTIQTMLTPTMMKRQSKSNSIHVLRPNIHSHPRRGTRYTFFK